MRLLYGTPPAPDRWRELDAAMPKLAEEWARERRLETEREALGKALFNLIAPMCGEEPLP